MPELKDNRTTSKITVPSSGGEIVIYDTVLFGDFTKMQDHENQLEMVVEVLVKLIRSWNFTSDGKDLPITAESIKLLPTEDVTAIINHITEVNKKKAA